MFSEKPIVLGTAQFGMRYGLLNSDGPPEESEVLEILTLASELEIGDLDTAPSYGRSEAVLGRSFKKMGKAFRVITKVPEIGDRPLRVVMESAIESCLRLQMDSVDTVLLHSSFDLIGPKADTVFETLLGLKTSGICRRVGVSLRSLDHLRAVQRFPVDVIQLPCNVFDQRLLEEKIGVGIQIHVRSPFLQGLLLQDSKRITGYFESLSEKFSELDRLCELWNTSRAQVALNYVKLVKQTGAVVLGVIDAHQLRENCHFWKEEPFGSLEDYLPFAVEDKRFVDPSRWPLQWPLQSPVADKKAYDH